MRGLRVLVLACLVLVTSGDAASAHRSRGPSLPPLARTAEPVGIGPVFRTGMPLDWCNPGQPGSADGRKIVVIYATPRDRDERFDLIAAKLQSSVAAASRYVAAESGGRKTLRFDVGNKCGPGYLNIHRMTLRHGVSRYRSTFDGELSGDSRKLLPEVRRFLQRKRLMMPENRFVVVADFLQEAPKDAPRAGASPGS